MCDNCSLIVSYHNQPWRILCLIHSLVMLQHTARQTTRRDGVTHFEVCTLFQNLLQSLNSATGHPISHIVDVCLLDNISPTHDCAVAVYLVCFVKVPDNKHLFSCSTCSLFSCANCNMLRAFQEESPDHKVLLGCTYQIT